MTALSVEEAFGYEDRVPRYDLGDDEIAYRLAELPPPERLNDQYLCVNIGSSHEWSDVARTVECRVFNAKFGNDAEQMAEEYGPYESTSRFLLVVHRDTHKPAGVLRVIHDSEAGLKALNDSRRILRREDQSEAEAHGVTMRDLQTIYGVDVAEHTWEVGTLAVMPEFRGLRSQSHVSALLYRALYVLATEEQANHLIMVIDEGALRNVEALGIPFEDIEGIEPFQYLGSVASHMMHGDVRQFEASVTERTRRTVKPHIRIVVNAVLGNILPQNRDGRRPYRRSVHRSIRRQEFARAAGLIGRQLATGAGLDEEIRYDELD